MKPLAGIKILDLCQYLPGPLGAQMLADFGAQVIKIEPPSGERGRIIPGVPLYQGSRSNFFNVNRNKKSLALDLKAPAGKEILKELVAGADVVMEQFRPGAMDKLGLGYESLLRENKGLIYCAITGYGGTGPLKMAAGHDNNYLSISGVYSISGNHDGPSLMGTQIADIAGGTLHAVIAILMALRARDVTGKGQYCDVSMTDAMVSTMLAYAWSDYWGQERAPERMKGNLNGGRACYHIYETADQKFMSLGAIEPKFWSAFCERAGRPEWIPRQNDPEAQTELIGEVKQLFRTRTQAEWVEAAADLDICLTPIIPLDEVLQVPHIKERQSVIQAENIADSGKTALLPGLPFQLSETPGEAVLRFSRLGEDNHEILRGIGLSETEIEALAAQGVIGH
jgi:crotonobetainyl-CoA:carnitine CoA-transferase CaiB-like acyl-CoA transferase